jgi:hypothetical protein
MASHPHLISLGVGTGGIGQFIQPDTEFVVISRTMDREG